MKIQECYNEKTGLSKAEQVIYNSFIQNNFQANNACALSTNSQEDSCRYSINSSNILSPKLSPKLSNNLIQQQSQKNNPLQQNPSPFSFNFEQNRSNLLLQDDIEQEVQKSFSETNSSRELKKKQESRNIQIHDSQRKKNQDIQLQFQRRNRFIKSTLNTQIQQANNKQININQKQYKIQIKEPNINNKGQQLKLDIEQQNCQTTSQNQQTSIRLQNPKEIGKQHTINFQESNIKLQNKKAKRNYKKAQISCKKSQIKVEDFHQKEIEDNENNQFNQIKEKDQDSKKKDFPHPEENFINDWSPWKQ